MQDTFYKLLGMAVWNAGKLYLRRRYVPKPVLAGVALALVSGIAVAVAASRRNGSEG